MESLWKKQTKELHAKAGVEKASLEKAHWDVIVIGAGMAGLLTAYYLQKEGKEVLVLEANKIASGQTERTTAKITSQHGLKYSKLLKCVGEEKARLYAKSNEAAIEEYARLIQEKGIECQFERASAYLYTKQDVKSLQDELNAASFLGIDAFFTRETELPFAVAGAVCFRNQAQFSPLEFLKHISAELKILEHTKVTDIKGNKVMTECAVFTAEKIVVATHYPIKNVPGFYFLRQHQERSYAIALSGCDNIKGMYLGIDNDGLSLRQAGAYLLMGGSSVRTGENICGGAFEHLRREAEYYYPDSKVEAWWAAQDCMPHDGIPFIGKYSMFTPHLYVATGFQKWGMTTSMVAAMLLRDELCGIKNPYATLYRPQRLHFLAATPSFLCDVGMSVKGLVKGWFGPKARRCSHMGCGLTWNPDERSWDCSCHGSRFDEKGKLLDNPAKKELQGQGYK